ncbi:hypothetical protein Tsubulata_028090 [Turnera subulata]|uniref:F-box domain-containing protein n=1 Tax=Turnera subulata TaxID=218843 RepID=A0A9Q0JEC4_9ROSI|nr:hypothetical protein Tsubulata_028090 [Turnera subulata]
MISSQKRQADERDRISQLPDNILHLILSSLQTRDAVRTRVLSKSWDQTWNSFCISDFDLSLTKSWHEVGEARHSMTSASEKSPLNFVHAQLAKQSNHGHRMQRLGLSMCPKLHNPKDSLLHNCIQLALQCGVKELDLNFQCSRLRCHGYVVFLYNILSATTLTSLSLSGCMLSMPRLPGEAISWPSLKVLSLTKIRLHEQNISNLISSSPLLEKFVLVHVAGLRNIQLIGFTKLREVKVIDTLRYIVKTEINAPSLETFWCGFGTRNCQLHVTPAHNIKVLELRNCSVSSEACQELISRCLALKVLIVHNYNWKKIEVSSSKLEVLQLYANGIEEVILDAPCLKSFQYTAQTIPPNFSMCKTSVETAALNLFPNYLSAYRFGRMQEFIGHFNQIKLLKLQFVCGFINFSSVGLKGEPPPSLLGIKHLELEIYSSLDTGDQKKEHRNYEALLDGLFWICHPESLMLTCGLGSNHEFLKVLCKELMDKVERQHSCPYIHQNCWGCKLKDVRIILSGWNEHGKDLTCRTLLDLLPTLGSQKKKISFSFKW